MANIKPLFKIKPDGFLYVSYDNGCTYEAIGEVVGPQGEQGEEGQQGEKGEDGVNGEDGANAKNPFIDGTTGTWWVYDDETGEAYDTEIIATGSNGAVVVDASADIGNVGTPRVSQQVVENTLHIQFHELKGEPGEPGKDGSSYRAGEYIEINEPEEEGLLPSIDCTLSAGVDISIDENDRINVVPSYTKRLVQQAEVLSYYKTTITSNVDGKSFSIASTYTTNPSLVSSTLSITYSKSALTTQYICLFDADGNGNNYQDFSLMYDGKTYYFCALEETSKKFTVMTDCPLRLYGFNPEDYTHSLYVEIPAWYHGSIVFHAGRYLTNKRPVSEEHAWSSSGSFSGTLLSSLPSQTTATVARYTYDMIVTDNLSEWEVPASEVTALRLSKLEERVTYLEHEVSSIKDELSDMHTTLTLGSTTLSESELQQLKALLQ